MYLKVVNPRLQDEVRPGDVVQAGVSISNSETGRGAVSRLHQVMAALIQRKEKGLAVPNLHAQASGVHHVVGLYLTLTPCVPEATAA